MRQYIMKIETVETSKLKPASYNPRKDLQPGDSEYQKIDKSIEKFGLVDPIIVKYPEMDIIQGHQRIKPLIAKGKTELNMIQMGDIAWVFDDTEIKLKGDADIKALNIALNKISGEWDDSKLSGLLGELSALPDFDIELTGFDLDEVAALNPAEVVEDNFDAGDALAAIDEPVTQRGDLIILGKHKLLCGDSTDAGDVERLMDGKKADLVLAAPPYGVKIVSVDGKVGADNKLGFVGGGKIVPVNEYREIIGDDTTDTAEKAYNIAMSFNIKNIILWGGNYFTSFLPPSPCWIIWDKENTGNFADVEMAWTSFERGAKLYKWLWNGLSRKGDRKSELTKRVHPTQKPVGLHVDILNDFTEEEDIIVDLFIGSGTTLIAAEQTNRICYGMEIDPKYCDVIVRRFEEYTHTKAIRPERQPSEKH